MHDVMVSYCIYIIWNWSQNITVKALSIHLEMVIKMDQLIITNQSSLNLVYMGKNSAVAFRCINLNIMALEAKIIMNINQYFRTLLRILHFGKLAFNLYDVAWPHFVHFVHFAYWKKYINMQMRIKLETAVQGNL